MDDVSRRIAEGEDPEKVLAEWEKEIDGSVEDKDEPVTQSWE